MERLKSLRSFSASRRSQRSASVGGISSTDSEVSEAPRPTRRSALRSRLHCRPRRFLFHRRRQAENFLVLSRQKGSSTSTQDKEER
jgi:hypothetical protein